MKSLKAIIIDDEASSRNSLRQKLANHCVEVEVIDECENGELGIRSIESLDADIVFLDVEMPRMNGFTMLQQLKKKNFEVIFTTAYDHYAVKAIRFSALDYLVKPVEVEELKASVERARIKKENGNGNERLETLLYNLVNQKSLDNRLAIPSQEGLQFITLSDIIYLEAQSSYSIIYTMDGAKIIVSKTLKDFEELLPHSIFLRIHHSYVINKNRITKYIRGEGGQVIMSNGKMLDVSRRKKEEFLNALKS
jgi:two-component system, LytTR family, response regulator